MNLREMVRLRQELRQGGYYGAADVVRKYIFIEFPDVKEVRDVKKGYHNGEYKPGTVVTHKDYFRSFYPNG